MAAPIVTSRANQVWVTRAFVASSAAWKSTLTLSDISTKPDDPGVEELIEVYRAVLGEHPDWDDYRRAMVADKRVVVRLRPTYAYGALGG